MSQTNGISKYITYTDAIKRLENDSGFRSLEESLVKTLDFLNERFGVFLAFDYFSDPKHKRNDMQFKIRNNSEELMWVYFAYSEKGKHLSLEIDENRISSVRSRLTGFDRINERHIDSWPSLKLIYRDYSRIEQSLELICSCIDGTEVVPTYDINSPMKPKGIIRKSDGTICCICGRCSKTFVSAARCPECGQLVKK